MVSMTLHAASSFARDLPASCTALSLKDGSIVAGSKDGMLISWLASTGEEAWRVSIEGPVSDIARSHSHVFVTASSSLYAIDDSDGSILWKRELEGASDYVLAVEGSIWATSSVYEIEVGDYTESSIWRFNQSGELGKRWVIPERSWFIGLSYGKVILGLGRPRCGVLSIDDDELEHFEVEEGLPIVCGDYRSEGEYPIAILGHSSGAITCVDNQNEAVKGENLISSSWWSKIVEEPSAVCCILVPDKGNENITAYENGFIKSNFEWSYDARSAVTAMAVGPVGDEEIGQTYWACAGERVLVLSSSDRARDVPGSADSGGQLILELGHECCLVECDSEGDTIALGDERGGIYLINSQFLSRRMGEGSVEITNDHRTSLMRERLRKLRE